MSVIGKPGDGNHVGGAFPLSRTPGDLETDLLGQLPRLPCVHIVDSSSLPSLAATTFTYTTMAHAHRIADAVARLSQA
jgi:choline dehydrogenase-like flavoprotein